MLNYIKYLAEQAWNLALSAIHMVGDYASWLFDRIVEWATWAYNTARDYARSLGYTLRALIELAKITLYSIILHYFNLAIQWINNTVAPLWNQIQTIIGLVAQRIREAITAFVEPIMRRIQPIIDWFNRLWQRIQDGINWVFNEGIHLPQKIRDLWELLRNDIIPSVTSFVKDAAPTLTNIVSDPFGFIYPYLKAFLWELLQFIIAYEMGTLKYTLPPFPTFNFTGTGGSMTYAESMQLDNSGLYSPLNYLRISGYRFGPGHPGLDLGLSNGDPVYAMHSGVVEFSGWSTVGYGYCVVVRGDNWWTRYAHCLGVNVEKDDTVNAGDVIGIGDSTGNSTGPHLHLEIKYNGVFVDPVSVLPV